MLDTVTVEVEVEVEGMATVTGENVATDTVGGMSRATVAVSPLPRCRRLP